MDGQRRALMAGTLPAIAWLNGWSAEARQQSSLVLSSFIDGENTIMEGTGWRGFSDRVMGGISNARLTSGRVRGKGCIRLSGNVTRESNGGFIQMALYFNRGRSGFDASAYKGLELTVLGNNEDYNVHIRTADCGWHDESYRATIFAEPQWQTIRLPWAAFTPNRVGAPLDGSTLQRIAVLGWMREFEADISLARLALYT